MFRTFAAVALLTLPIAASAAPPAGKGGNQLEKKAERAARECLSEHTQRGQDIVTTVETTSICFASGFTSLATVGVATNPPEGTLGPVTFTPIAEVSFGCSNEVTNVTCLPDTCELDSDCPSWEWCGYSSSSERTCKAYVGAGDSCEGFTLPEYYERCDPSLTCVTDPYIADLPGVCATCDYFGTPYMAGDSFTANDGCNTCFCGEDGLVGCTKIACPN